MRVLTKAECNQKRHSLPKELKKSIFVYPTDSIYGLGCDATNPELVQRIRELKNSSLQPFSVIAPSKDWIRKNCVVTKEAETWIERLGKRPVIDGAEQCITLILRLKKKDALAKSVTQGLDSIGVRIPKHWISEIIADMGVPVVTTSANPVGGDFMTRLENLHPRIKNGVDICLYAGEKKGHPSTLIYLNKEMVDIKKR